MAAKKKKSRKNPTHARKAVPAKRKKRAVKRFTVSAYAGSTLLGKQSFASQKKAESVAKNLLKSGKASKCFVED